MALRVPREAERQCLMTRCIQWQFRSPSDTNLMFGVEMATTASLERNGFVKMNPKPKC